MRALALAWALLFVLISSAATAGPCAPRADVEGVISDKYGEEVVGYGIDQGGRVAEIWAGRDGGWTFTLTYPNGITCVVTAGSSWEIVLISSLDSPSSYMRDR